MVTSATDLYSLRRDMCGLISTDLVRERLPRNEYRSYALALMRILDLGGILTSDRISFKTKQIRLVQTGGQPMSSVINRFTFEPPPNPKPDYVVCAGANEDPTPAHLIRAATTATVVRPAPVGIWMTDDKFIHHEMGIL
jgi:hypothetical protein